MLEQLAALQYTIVLRPGKDHTNADALSRLPAYLGDAIVTSVSQVEVKISLCFGTGGDIGSRSK